MQKSFGSRQAGTIAVVLGVFIFSVGLLFIGIVSNIPTESSSAGPVRQTRETAQLISVEPFPESFGALCQWVPASTAATAFSIAGQEPGAGADEDRKTEDIAIPPVRMIRDPNPAFSSIAVAPESNMLVVTDENLFRVLEYDRRDNTPANARMTEPKRVIGGDRTKAEMMCGVYIDPVSLDTYVVNNDTQDWLVVFSKDTQGNARPDRELAVPHGTFGIAVDEGRQELYLTVEHQNSVIVYPKMASGQDAALREIKGSDTQLEDPHGIAVDTKRDLLFVTNHGSVKSTTPVEGVGGRGQQIRGSGRFEPPSITVHARDASGNASPLRIIEGPKTRLNWPMQMGVDMERGEIYVANDMDHSIVVFGVMDDGDVAPRRVIRGPKTGLRNPTGIGLDLKNREVWVSSMGNHRALAFSLDADGNVAPKRMVRGGPADEMGLMIGNPGGVGYDTRREQILVPN